MKIAEAEASIGELVVTKNDAGQIMSVTLQDEDGKVLSVVAESAPVVQGGVMSKTVRVRIAVVVDPSGCWGSCGGSGVDDDSAVMFARESVEPGEARYFLEADLEIPDAKAIAATVIPAKD